MAANKSFIVLVVLLYALLPTCGAGSVRDDIRRTYLSQVGIREATGRNDGAEIETYLHSVGGRVGQPWCAAFVYWCFRQNAVKAPRSPYSPDFFRRNIIYTRGAPISKLPSSGDVFGIYFPGKGRIAHVGFIDKWGEKWVETVEGNTNAAGSREGDGVYKKKRLSRQIYQVADYLTKNN
jgi:hypothetical protein